MSDSKIFILLEARYAHLIIEVYTNEEYEYFYTCIPKIRYKSVIYDNPGDALFDGIDTARFYTHGQANNF